MAPFPVKTASITMAMGKLTGRTLGASSHMTQRLGGARQDRYALTLQLPSPRPNRQSDGLAQTLAMKSARYLSESDLALLGFPWLSPKARL